ncbi:galactose oxidase-like domain-containing protein [Shimia thalassica]|uniref:galactose oxidase-like domain-containing protein n=1 Tax=Shimia thalassica TaxID=1715693 RepID=UPI0027327F1D|nr:galactose oxidase-like domain-containing protein [Shimia thalassica]MDP2518844.1 DUF1929 domain-containing protein [Shimia thalassica]
MIPSDLRDEEGNGQWAPLIDWPLIGIHAMVLPTGQVLSYGTDENGMQGGQFVYALYDYRTGDSQLLEQTTETDLFCSNMGFDSYLSVTLAIGGDEEPLGYRANGVSDVNVFDHSNNSIRSSPEGTMEGGRWYPTIVALGNGDLLALGGRADHVRGRGGNTDVEIYRSGVGWTKLDAIEPPIFDSGKWWYPSTFLRSDGTALMIEGTSRSGGADMYLIDTSGDGAMTHVGVLPFSIGIHQPSIMYRTDKALMMDVQGDLWTVDFSDAVPVFEEVVQLGAPRRDSDFTLLADGRVVLNGGARNRNVLEEADTTLVIFDPETNTVTEVEDEDLARMYHSSSVLLPDGTFASIGGGAPGPLVNTNAQIWAPDYLFAPDGSLAARQETELQGVDVKAGGRFMMYVEDTSDLSQITALRAGASTHSKDSNSRFLDLSFEVVDANSVEVILPDNPNVIIPGTWMVFAFDNSGVPSEAQMLDVVPGLAVATDDPGSYSFGSSTYMLGTAGLTWHEAVAEAESLGGRMVEINSPEENAFISETFFRDNPIWLGLTDEATEGVFLNTDSSVPDYANWMQDFETNRDANHNYVIMTNEVGEWRASRVGPAVAYFDRDGRPQRADNMSVIEFENTRELIAQTGEVSVRNSTGDEWFSVQFDSSMDNPIVVVSPLTYVGRHPATVSLRNVSETGFEMQVSEWDYLDGRHARETVSWMAVEQGIHVLDDGAVIEAGSSRVTTRQRHVELNGEYEGLSPVVIAQVATSDHESVVTDRLANIDADGFDIRLQEQESNRNGHPPETVHWISFMEGNHNAFSAFSDERGISHHETDIDLTRSIDRTHVFADLQSDLGRNTSVLRVTERDEDSVTMFLQEEQSLDSEMLHGRETLGWLTVDDMIFV